MNRGLLSINISCVSIEMYHRSWLKRYPTLVGATQKNILHQNIIPTSIRIAIQACAKDLHENMDLPIILSGWVMSTKKNQKFSKKLILTIKYLQQMRLNADLFQKY